MRGLPSRARGQGDTLALPAGEAESPLADGRVVAVGQGTDEIVSPGGAGRGDDLLEGRVRPAVGDVVPHGLGEQEPVLEGNTDLAPQRREGHVPQVVAVHEDRSGLRVVESFQEKDGAGLA